MAVTAIAERAVLRVLATAPRNGFCLGDIHFARHEAGAFVRAVAERLRLRRAARAPPKGARPGFLNKRRSLDNNWLAHGGCSISSPASLCNHFIVTFHWKRAPPGLTSPCNHARPTHPLPPVGREPGRQRAPADGERLPVARLRRRRAHARRPCRLRPAHRRRARHRQRGHPLRRRRGHRLPHETHRARFAAGSSPPPRNRSHPLPSKPRPASASARIQPSPHPSGDGRGLVRQPRHATLSRQGRGATRHQRQRQPFRGVRRIHRRTQGPRT